MTYQFTISDIGVRLIKAYEGFNAQAVKLGGGYYLIGFGHRLSADDDISSIDEAKAESLLEQDLAPVEGLINRYVHGGMTQSQFDALCSLVYTIGARAFLQSSILHDLNQGKIIEAANGFDQWRYGQIAGKTYMVDALVRRRTAEKALFLRPTVKTPAASRYDLTPLQEGQKTSLYPAPWTDQSRENGAKNISDDEAIAHQDMPARQLASTNEARIYAEDETEADLNDVLEDDALLLTDQVDMINLVETQPAPRTDALKESDDTLINDLTDLDDAAAKLKQKELEFQSKEAMEASRLHEVEAKIEAKIDAEIDAEIAAEIDEQTPSPIAEAAAEVSERLDALMGRTEPNDSQKDWPNSMVKTGAPEGQGPEAPDNVVNIHTHQNRVDSKPDIIIDELEMDDAMRSLHKESGLDSYYYQGAKNTDYKQNAGLWAYTVMMVLGATLTIGGILVNLQGSSDIFGKFGPLIAVSSVMLGVLLFLIGTYHLLKTLFGR